MRKLIVFLMLLLPVSAAADEWTPSDTYRESAFLVLSAMDWRQTMDIANNKAGYINNQYSPGLVEVNPLLGSHPTNSRINTYFSLGIATQYLIAVALPENLRAPWQAAGIVLETYYVQNNYKLNLKFRF